jgi:hypothetical protein
MHYYNGAFGTYFTTADGVSLPVCIPDIGSIGQRVGPSALDIDQLRLLYQCASGSRAGPVQLEDYCTTDCPCWEGAIGDCDNDNECQGDLICGTPYDDGPEEWFCESSDPIVLPTNMCIADPKLDGCFLSRAALNNATAGISGSAVGYTPSFGNYGPIEGWCFAPSLTDFSGLFRDKAAFNAPIG